MSAGGERRTLLVSENAPVPADRRVWSEARTLAAAGWRVVVVCPQGRTRCAAPYEVIEGVEIHRFPLRPAAGGAASYAREYGQAMFRIARLVARVSRDQAFDVVHAANPPDFLLLAAWHLRRRGTRFVFDHHDLVPELYRSRFGAGKGLLYRASRVFERLAFRLADVSIATNDSYRRIAIERGRMPAENVFVVRNGPDVERFTPTEADPALKRDRDHLIAYVGMMGPQDGIDHAVRTLELLRRRRDDWRAILVGDGDVLEEMRALAVELGLDDVVEFAGWRDDDDIRRILSTADVCLAPDPPSPLNDRSTMIKVAEYLAMGRAVASYELPESKVTAGPAARFATPGDAADLARCIDELLADPAERARLARLGRERVEERLSWQHSERELLRAYERAVAHPAPARAEFQRSELRSSA
jgi:glycosyltransferase involved in cell wall biosynthesis